MTLNLNQRPVRLRLKAQPYLGMGAACALWLAMLMIIAGETRTWAPLWEFGWLPILLFAGWVFVGTRYRIFYDGNLIKMVASGRPPVIIKFDEIEGVKNEISIERGRPFRRVAIFVGDKFIDVSPKHFAASDIRNLLHAIHNHRPDLLLPRIKGERE